ncbi:MAG: polysaccharide deacetylase family protein [Calditrichaeota bacterium]|nr:polysaccharide deacetylase family protein [Calditrichota bacterium]MCB0268460.1 polysaccharide deacetylase family protein [Calditrichota bacterium]
MIKVFVSYILYYSGLLTIARWLQAFLGQRITIITFHRVGDHAVEDGLPTLYVTPESFEKTISFLMKNYDIISLSEYSSLKTNARPLPPNPLIITFDDGYRDCYINAFPVLQKNRIPFTMFLPANIFNGGVDFWWDRLYHSCSEMSSAQIIASLEQAADVHPEMQSLIVTAKAESSDKSEMVIHLIDKLGDFPPATRLQIVNTIAQNVHKESAMDNQNRSVVNLPEIHEMLQSGGEIGSHTKSHCFLDTVPTEEAIAEIQDSKIALERLLSTKIRHFAYPAGRWSPEIRDMVENANYSSACVVAEDVNKINQDLFTLKRLSICEPLITKANGEFCKALLASRLVLAGFIAYVHRRWLNQ